MERGYPVGETGTQLIMQSDLKARSIDFSASLRARESGTSSQIRLSLSLSLFIAF